MKRMCTFCLTVLFTLLLAGCAGAEQSAPVPASTPVPPAGEQSGTSLQSETTPQSEASRTWTREEVLELYEAEREETWETADCVTFYDQASGLVGAVLFQNSDTPAAGVAFLGADGSCRMGSIDTPLADEPEFEYLGDGAVTFKVQDESGKIRSHTMSITIEGVNVTFKSVDK